MAFCHAGDPAEGETAIAPLRAIREPLASVAAVQPFAGFQQAFDPLLTPGARNYWKSHDMLDLGEPVVETLIDAAQRLPDAESEIFVAHLGGAMSRVAPDATAFVQRAPHFVVNIHTRWRDPAKDAAAKAWAREPLRRALALLGRRLRQLHAGGGKRPGGRCLRRKPRAAVERSRPRYDPDNRFRHNQNIAPAVQERLAG